MKSLKGHLLLAAPMLSDENFCRSVVLMIEHSRESAWGVILNRPTRQTLAQALPQVFEEKGRTRLLFEGGPVMTGSLVFLSAVPLVETEEEQRVIEGVWVGGTAEQLTAVAERDPDLLRVFAGHAGWGGGQLEGELAVGSWIVRPATTALVFASKPRALWQTALREMGGVHALAAIAPPDPMSN